MRKAIFILIVLLSICLIAGCTDDGAGTQPAITPAPTPGATAQQPTAAPAQPPTATPTPPAEPTPSLSTQDGLEAIEDMLEQLESIDFSDADYSE